MTTTTQTFIDVAQYNGERLSFCCCRDFYRHSTHNTTRYSIFMDRQSNAFAFANGDLRFGPVYGMAALNALMIADGLKRVSEALID